MFRFLFGDTRDSGEYGHEDNGNIDSIFQHVHSDMQQHMEEIQQQMDDMMKNFGTVEFSNVPPLQFPITDRSGFSNSGMGNLRDEMLKSPDAPAVEPQIPSQPSTITIPSPGQQDRSFFGAFGLPKLSPIFNLPDEPKVDRDLDGRGADDVLKDLQSSRCTECPVQRTPSSNLFFSGKSVSVRCVQGPDGQMEQWRTVQDTSGRKEETCTRYVDGKMHTITRTIDDKGNKEEIEEFKNMDETDLSRFNKTWNKDDPFPPEMPLQPRQDSYLGSVLKLFGFGP